jgi:hypothetical protein
VRRPIVLVALVLIAACSSDGGGAPGTGESSTTSEETTTTLDPRPCRETVLASPGGGAGAPTVERLPSGNPHAAAIAASQATFECSETVVITDTADIERLGVAAVLAASLPAPLILAEEEASSLAAYELERLAPLKAIVVGDVALAPTPEWTEVERISGATPELAVRIADLIDAPDTVVPLEAGRQPADRRHRNRRRPLRHGLASRRR